MRASHLAASGCVVAALSLGVAACGSSSSGGNTTSGSKSLTIYSSLPLQGESRIQSVSIANGEKLALKAAGGKVGDFKINYESLDNATAETGKWDPKTTAGNARSAAQDQSAIAYLGDFDSGASAISIPVLNVAGILQISATNKAVGLTRSEGAEKGEPEKYYPTARRTYGRVIPADHIQAAAQVIYQKDEGCTETYVLHEDDVSGKGLANQVVLAAKTQGLATVGIDRVDEEAAEYRSVAREVRASGADCVFFGGSIESNAVQLFKDLHAANPTAKLFGPSGLAVSAFSSKIGRGVEKVTYITDPTLEPKLYPPSGQAFFKKYKATYGVAPESYAIYGYEAMSAALAAIKNAGAKGNNKQAVVNGFFKIKDRRSVLGTYSIDENGDTSLSRYGGKRVRDGKLVFDKLLNVKR